MAKRNEFTYEGPAGFIVIDGVRLNAGRGTVVEDEALRAELREGSDRLSGHKFKAGASGSSRTTSGAGK